MTINGETTGVRTVSSHKRGRALLASTALGATLFIAAPAAAQSISQTSATGEPISVNSTTASSTAADVHAIYVQTDGPIDIVSGTATATGARAYGIYALGGAGDVSIDSNVASASGNSGPAVYGRATSGNVLINSVDATNSGGAYDFAADTTGEGVLGYSDTGRVEIRSGIARTSAQYGSAVIGSGGEILIITDEAYGTAVQQGALVSARATIGDATAVSGLINATGSQGTALAVSSQNGFATVTSGTLTAPGTNFIGISATGKTGVSIESGTVAVGGQGISGVSSAGQVAVVSDVTNVTGTAGAIIATGATGATVSANSVNTGLATQDGIRATATTGNAAIDVGTVTGSAAFQSVRGIANAGAVTINAGSVANSIGSGSGGGITGQGLNGVTINAGTVDSSGWAIRAFTNIGGTLGEGHVSVNTTGAITSRNSNAISISGNVASFDVTIGADSVVTGNASATVAAGARGDIVIDNQGTILARGNAEGGIGTTSANGNVTVTSNIIDVEGLTAPGTAFVSGGIAAVSNGGGLVSVTSNDVTVAGQNRHGIYAASNGAITIDSDSVATSASATTAQLAGIYAAGGAGAVTITSDTITTSGIGSSAIYATSSSGDISIIAADSRSTALNVASDLIYSDVLVGISDTGNVTIDSGYSESASLYGSAIVAIGNNVSITSDEAVATGDQGVAVYGSAAGAVDIVSGSIVTSGTGSAINGLTSAGTVAIMSGSITGSNAQSTGIFARGAGGVAMTLGSVSTGRYAVGAESANGDVAITTTGAITSATQNGLTINNANNAIVNVGADSVVNGGFSGVSATSRDSATIVNAGTVTARGSIAGARSSAITVTAPGAISITSNIANMTGPGADPGLDTSTGFRFGQGGITANGGAGAIVIDSASVNVAGEGRFGIFASGSGTIDISSANLTNAARDSSGIFIVGGAGAVTVDSGTLTTTGQSGSGIVARSTSGAITITADETHANATGSFGNFTADAVVGISQTGAVAITSNNASSAGYAGSAVAGIGGSVAIESATAVTTGDYGAAVYADATSGNASITSGSVATSGLSTDAVVASATGGSVTLVSGTVSSTGTGARGIFADGQTGTTVDSGNVSTGGRALFARSTGGDTLVNITGDVVSGTNLGVNAIGGNIAVNIGADHSVAGATRALQLNARTQSTVVNAGTITGGQSGITSETGRLTLTNSGTIRGNGTVDGFSEIPHAGVSLSQADGVVTNSGTISGAGFGITTAAYFNPATGLVEPRAINTSVVNSGIIRGDNNDGVRLIGGGIVANTGTIEGLVGVGADGISMFNHGGQNITALSSIGTVTNAAGGIINGARFGMLMTGGAVVENAGTIGGGLASIRIQANNGTGTTKVANVTNSGTLNGGIGIGPNIASATVINSGSITTGGFSHGIDVHADAVTIDNSGTIAATGGMFGIGAYSFGALAIANSGTISGADGVEAVAGGASLSFVNSGTITGTGNEGGDELHGVTLIAGYNPVTFANTVDADSASFANSGTITGEVTLDFAALNGSFVNSGTITGQLNDSVVDFNVYRLDGGDAASAAFTNSGTLNGAIEAEINATSVVFANSGTILATGSGEDGEAALDIDADSLASSNIVFTNASGGAITSTGAGTFGVLVQSEVGEGAAGQQGVISFVNDGRIVANAGGQVFDASAAPINGADTLVTFAGGLGMSADSAVASQVSLVNGSTGVIEATGTNSVALVVRADSFTLNNAGRIAGGDGTAFSATTIDGGDLELVDFMLETGNSRIAGAIQTLLSTDSITNNGTIIGSVDLDSGDDIFVNSGTIDGLVEMGSGDDGVRLATGSAVTGAFDGGDGFDSAELAGTSATLTASQTLAEMRNFEELTVSSGYWTASSGVSEFGSVGIAAGATLNVKEIAVNGVAASAVVTEEVRNDGLLVIDFDSDEVADIESLAIAGSGDVRLDGEAAFVVDDGTLAFTGDAIVANGSLTVTGAGGLSGNVVTSGDGVFILGDGGTTGDFTGDIVNDGGFVFNRSNDYELLGALSGSGDFTKMGAGTLSLAGPYSFTGTTSILGGSVRFAGQIDPETTIDLQSGTFDISGAPQTIAELSGGSESAINIDDSQLTVNQASNTTFAGDIVGDGGLVKEGDGVLNLTGNSTYTGDTVVNQGAVAVNGSIASTVIVNDGGTLKGNGTMGGAVLGAAATAAPGNSIGTLNVAGNVSFAAGSIYEVEVDATGASDRIVATGTATLTGGTVQVLAAQGTYRPFTAYTIIQAGGGVTGRFAGTTSNLAFLTPLLAYSANAVSLELIRNDIDFSGVATSANQASTAAAIEGLGFRNALYLDLAVQDAAGAQAAFDTLSGELYASVPSAIINDNRHVGAALRDAGRMAADGPGVWGQAMGSWGELEGRDGVADLDTDYKGLIGGVNFGRDGLGGGIAAGLAKSEYEAEERASEAEVDTTFVGAHIAYRQGPLTAQAGGAYSWHDISAERSLVFPGFAENAESRYDADTTMLFAEVGYALPGAGPVAVEPFARLEHFRTGTDGFDESGESGALGLEDGKRSVQFGSIGLRAAGSLPVSPTMMLEPKASIALRHGWGDLGGRSTASFAGGSGFDVLGSRLAKNAAELDVGFALKSQNFRIGASYRGLLSERGKDHGAQLTLGYAF